MTNVKKLLQQLGAEPAARQPDPPVPPVPGPGPEMIEDIAGGVSGGGSTRINVDNMEQPDAAPWSVHLAPPGFTVCESFFDSGEFTCFNPEIVFGTQVYTDVPVISPIRVGDTVWCCVYISNGEIDTARTGIYVGNSADTEATVCVKVAKVTKDGVIQYHTGAIIVGEGGQFLHPWKIGSVPVGYTDGGGVERTRDVLTVYLPEGSLNIAGDELEVYDLAWGALDPVAAGSSVYYVLPSAQRSQLGDVWLNIYSLDDSDDETSGGETSGGETSGGETSGGETSGGETSGGETSGSTGQELPSYKACVSLTEAGPGAPSGYKLFTTIRICSVETDALDVNKISELTQAVVGAIALDGGGGGGGGGSVSVDDPKIAAISIEFTGGDHYLHPYAIKLTRGYLTETDGVLTIKPPEFELFDEPQPQYIDTVPISSVVSADSLIPTT